MFKWLINVKSEDVFKTILTAVRFLWKVAELLFWYDHRIFFPKYFAIILLGKSRNNCYVRLVDLAKWLTNFGALVVPEGFGGPM